MSRRAFDKKVEALLALRAAPLSTATVEQLGKALQDKSNYVVSKAAALVGELGVKALVQGLRSAFGLHLEGGAKSDPQCWAKNAIIQALRDLDHRDPDVFLSGLSHFQFEPVWGGRQDTAAALRGNCALALVQTALDDYTIRERLVDLLGDPERPVRVDAVRAMAQMANREAQLALRLKAIVGDAEPEVVGQCFAALLDLNPLDHLGFVAKFLKAGDDAALEAIAALGECREACAVDVLRAAWPDARRHHAGRAMVRALGASRHDQSVAFLMELLTESDVDIAADVITALAQSRFRERARGPVAAILETRRDRTLLSLYHREFKEA